MPMELDFTKYPALRAIVESIQEGVAIYSADRKLLYINDAMKAVTGGTQVIGSEMRDIASRHRIFTEDGRELAESDFPIERAFRGEETHDTLFEYVGPNGGHRWLTVSCHCIKHEGALAYVVTTIIDRTRRKNRDDKLRFMIESAKILSLTADFRQRLIEKAKLTVPSLADWCAIDILTDDDEVERIAVIHQDPKRIEFIHELERKYPPDKHAPDSIYNVIKHQRPQHIPKIAEEMIAAAPISEEQRDAIRKLNLSSIIVIPISARGRGLGAMTLAYAESGRTYSEEDYHFFQEFAYHVGVVLDSARLFREVERRDKAKDLFLASLSHELRNPLAPIKSSIELLKFKELLPEVRDELNVIEHQFDHMSRLLNDLLDVSRFTSSKITVSLRPVDLKKLVERALRATDALLRTADITLHVSTPSTSLSVRADETRLEQAIVNLMSNAAKFTPAGGSIWVDVEKSEDDVRIKVRDSGAGIAAEDLPNIFEMYYQSRRASNVNSGLGIGLLLVKEIVALHGGMVEAHSEGIGRGSEFVITIPLSKDSAPEEKSGTSGSNIKDKRILIIDDNVQAADSLARLLRKLGAHTDALYSGNELLSRPDLSEIDAFLIDIGMPHMDGYELVQKLRGMQLSQPMVALTGYGMAEDKRRAHEAGFTAHLTKPIGVQELRDLFADLFS